MDKKVAAEVKNVQTRVPVDVNQIPLELLTPDSELLKPVKNANVQLATEEVGKLPNSSPSDGSEPWFWRGVVILMSALWGSNFVVVEAFTTAETSASLFAATRFWFAALGLLPFLFTKQKLTSELVLGGLEVGLWVGLGYCCQAIGLVTTTANKSAFIASLQVLFVVLYNAITTGKLERKAAASTLLGLLGVGLIELAGHGGLNVGDLWSIGMPVFFGFSYIRIAKFMSKYPDAALPFSALQMLGVALLATVWAIFDQGQLPLPQLADLLSGGSLVAIAYTGLITTAFAVILQSLSYKRLPTTEVSVLLVTEPVWAGVFSAIFLHSQMNTNDYLGSGMILAACLICELPRNVVSQYLPWLVPDEPEKKRR